MSTGVNIGCNAGENLGSSGARQQAAAPSGDAVVWAISAHSVPAGGANGEKFVLAIIGQNLASVTGVTVDGNVQTIHTAPADHVRTLDTYEGSLDFNHDFDADLVAMVRRKGIFDATLNLAALDPVEIMWVNMNNVSAGDSSLNIAGVGMVIDEFTETNPHLNSFKVISSGDTFPDFTVHTGDIYILDGDAGSDGVGTTADPFNSNITARAAMGNGDALFIREISGQYVANIEINSNDTFIPFTASDSGTVALPKFWGCYPGENPILNPNTGSFIGMSPTDVLGNATFFGLGSVNLLNPLTNGGSTPINWPGNAGGSEQNLRFVDIYAYGVYSAASGSLVNVSGADTGGSWTGVTRNINIVLCRGDLSQEPNPTDNNPHVFYFPGRGWSEWLRFIMCKNTRHGGARVMQTYGHKSDVTCEDEKGRNYVYVANQLWGSIGTSHNPSAQGCIISHSDPNPYIRQCPWVENAYFAGGTYRGCGTGVDIYQITDNKVYADFDPILIVDLNGTIGLDNTNYDIRPQWAHTVNITDSIVEKASPTTGGYGPMVVNKTNEQVGDIETLVNAITLGGG